VLKIWCALSAECTPDRALSVQVPSAAEHCVWAWNEWAVNYCTHFSDPKNFKVAAFIPNVLKKLGHDTLALQHNSALAHDLRSIDCAWANAF